MIRYSIIDISLVPEGGDAALSLHNSRDLAQKAERWGYHRFWLAEHHNMPGSASAATSIVIAHVAAATSTIRVGAGGIMLQNHAPLLVAEQFGTLASLYPGRIDLGLGRGSGADPATARTLRRGRTVPHDEFPREVARLMNYFAPSPRRQRLESVPGGGLTVPIWILGSSLFGARLAAALGLPFAFASHFAPAVLEQAIATYRDQFQPSERLARPYVMLGFNVFGADRDEDAHSLASSAQRVFVDANHGRPARKLQAPQRGYFSSLSRAERAVLAQMMRCSSIGAPDRIRADLAAFVLRTAADEVLIASRIFDHRARLRSYEIAAAAMASMSCRGRSEATAKDCPEQKARAPKPRNALAHDAPEHAIAPHR